MIFFEKAMFSDNTLSSSGTFVKVGEKFRSANAQSLGQCVSITMDTPADNVIKVTGTHGVMYVNVSNFQRGWPAAEHTPTVQGPMVSDVQPIAPSQAVQQPAKKERKKKKDGFDNAFKAM